MDAFTETSRKRQVWSTMVVGGTFGIFLTFGNAWSEFLREAILACVPDHEHVVIRALIYALSASFFCMLVLFSLLRIDRYMQQITERLPKIRFHNRMTNVSRDHSSRNIRVLSRQDIARAV